MTSSSHYQVYLVGGAVRDELLGLDVVDRDWVITGAAPEDLLAEGFQQVGKQFPVFLHPANKEEYALARTEKKQGNGYTGFICDFAPSITLEEDLVRRDLTINAIAKDKSGRLIDPFNGQDDLKKGVLRHVSEAFIEDPLRVLRVARFAARFAEFGFSVAPETLRLMTHISQSGELQTLSKERVWRELEKALNYTRPDLFFDVLQECGALTIILPDLEWNAVKKRLKANPHILKSLGKPALIWAFIGHKTPPEKLQQLQEKLACPNQFKSYATLTNHFFHSAQLPLSATEWVDWLNQFNAIKKPQVYTDLTQVLCLLTNTVENDWQSLRESIASVRSKELIQQGYNGAELGLAIKQAKIESLLNDNNPLVKREEKKD